MNIFRTIASYGIVVWLLIASVSGAAAQEREPLKVIPTRVGPYPVQVHYYSDPHGGQALEFGIVPDDPAVGALNYQVTAVPGTATNAVPVRAKLEPDPKRPNAVIGQVNLPVSGQWTLEIIIEGPQGQRYSRQVPVLAIAPPAIPEWLGWAIGLLPVWIILVIVGVSARRRPAPTYVTT